MGQDKTDKHPQRLVQDYLDALLFDPDEAPADPPDPKDAVVHSGEADSAHADDAADGSRSPDSDPADIVPASADANGNDAESRADAEMIASYGGKAETECVEASETPTVAAPATRPVDNPTLAYRPAWVADEFNTVLVRMHGLRLAVPLNQVEGVQHLKGLSLALDREHDWVLGRYQSRTGPVRVVDTALWLIPERYNPALARYEEALVLPGRHWALACDELLQSLNLKADQVSWNGDRAARPWLLGTCSAERCFLIDIPALLIQLDDAFSVSADPRGIL